jgi:hypothetical protein
MKQQNEEEMLHQYDDMIIDMIINHLTQLCMDMYQCMIHIFESIIRASDVLFRDVNLLPANQDYQRHSYLNIAG